MDTTGLPYAKPVRPPKPRRRVRRGRRKEAARVLEVAVIAAVREEVFALDPRCVMCLRLPSVEDEMHEVFMRSLTRGLPPELRFNRRNCVRLCSHCHRDVTEHRAEIGFFVPEQGAEGGVVSQWKGQRAMLYRRGQPPVLLGPGRVWRRQWWPEAA